MAQEPIALEIGLAAETARDLEQAIAEHGWERDEGLRQMLRAGLDYVLGKKTVPAVPNDLTSQTDLQRQLIRMIGTGSRLAALRYRVQQLEKSRQARESTYGEMLKESSLYRQRVWEQIQETTVLRSEIRRLRDELAARETAGDESLPQQGWRSWLRRLGRR